ncbi:MAG: ABC transporter substrate-binding protein [Massiliimalia sp.]
MSLLKRIICCAVALTFSVSVLAGCTGQTKNQESQTSISSQTSEVSEEESSSSGEIVLTDQIGRTVTLEQPAEKVVSAYYLSSSLLIALGAQDKLVGIEMKAETRELYRQAAPEFLELPAVGSGKGINVEETAALEPDLVILPKKLQDSVAQFEALNIPVMVIDPETMENFLTTVSLLGQATGCDDRAQQLTSYYREVMEDVSSRTKDLEEKPLVYLAGSDMLSTAGAGMYQNDLIEMAGGVNAAASIDMDQWADISAEQLVAWNPEKVFLVNYADYTRDDFLADTRFANLKAMENPEENVLVFPGELEPWDYPTASSVLGILWLANQLHPDVVSQEEYETAVSDFYKTYFNLDVDAVEAEQPAA